MSSRSAPMSMRRETILRSFGVTLTVLNDFVAVMIPVRISVATFLLSVFSSRLSSVVKMISDSELAARFTMLMWPWCVFRLRRSMLMIGSDVHMSAALCAGDPIDSIVWQPMVMMVSNRKSDACECIFFGVIVPSFVAIWILSLSSITSYDISERGVSVMSISMLSVCTVGR